MIKKEKEYTVFTYIRKKIYNKVFIHIYKSKLITKCSYNHKQENKAGSTWKAHNAANISSEQRSYNGTEDEATMVDCS